MGGAELFCGPIVDTVSGADMTNCLRALLCEHPQICSWWVDGYCAHDPIVQELRQHAGQVYNGLTQFKSQRLDLTPRISQRMDQSVNVLQTIQQESDFDSSLSAKNCI